MILAKTKPINPTAKIPVKILTVSLISLPLFISHPSPSEDRTISAATTVAQEVVTAI